MENVPIGIVIYSELEIQLCRIRDFSFQIRRTDKPKASCAIELRQYRNSQERYMTLRLCNLQDRMRLTVFAVSLMDVHLVH